MFRKTAQASGYQGYKGSYNKGGWSSTGYQASWSGDGGSKGGSRGMSTAAKGETSEKGEKGDRGGEKVSYVVHAAGPQRHEKPEKSNHGYGDNDYYDNSYYYGYQGYDQSYYVKPRPRSTKVARLQTALNKRLVLRKEAETEEVKADMNKEIREIRRKLAVIQAAEQEAWEAKRKAMYD